MTAAHDAILPAGLIKAETQFAIAAENWKLLRYLAVFRLTVAVTAAALALSHAQIPPFGEASPEWFTVYSLVYAAIGLLAMETLRQRRPSFETQASVLTFLDVAFITLLMHTSGGQTSGLGLLLVVVVGGASFILGRRMTAFFAALATVAVLIEHSWPALAYDAPLAEGYPQIGMLGLGLFATAMLAYSLATRLRATEALAVRQGVDLANLAQINDLIIQRMQSGALVCDTQGKVRQMNKAAKKFFGLQESAPLPALPELAADFAAQFFQWLQSPASATRKLLRTHAGYTLMPRFVLIGDDQDSGILIFLEDTAILRQQAQQLKMAALARLTASIAHEIRNPLGAITNAAQLLAESVTTPAGEEQRLLRIIEDQGRRMNVIVENVMQLSRRDRVNPRRVALGPWLREFVATFCDSVRMPTEAIAVVGEAPLDVCVDVDQLYQVVGNLCQNAFRHSGAFNGERLVELQYGRDNGDPYLDVVDWGSGVSPEVADNIFDPFFTTTPKGTGLGLYIARELCEGNGGRLDYCPGEGVGSRFRITFSRAEQCAD